MECWDSGGKSGHEVRVFMPPGAAIAIKDQVRCFPPFSQISTIYVHHRDTENAEMYFLVCRGSPDGQERKNPLPAPLAEGLYWGASAVKEYVMRYVTVIENQGTK
jgi:hypothetical protein